MSLMSFYNVYKFPVNIILLANVYGIYQQVTNLIALASIRFLNNQKLDLHGGGISLRSFVYVSDVVNALLKIILNAQIGELFHVATRQSTSIHDIVYMIVEALSRTIDWIKSYKSYFL